MAAHDTHAMQKLTTKHDVKSATNVIMKLLYPIGLSWKKVPNYVCTITKDELKPILSCAPPASIIQTMPAEILFLILDHLDTVSIACLKNTNRFLRSSIGMDPTKLDRCTKWLITCRFEQDLAYVADDWGEPLVCALCKFKRVREDFTGDIAPLSIGTVC
ncbi:hypothetical protein G7Y79_00056g090290 [Physcia stellaris]|nr:hypothetical protein G7Y79_00056g090290 [Physcia stellaris]